MDPYGSTEIGHHDSTQMDHNERTIIDQRSPLVELLAYPTPTQKTSTAKSCAGVLTSADSIAMFEEKLCKKEAQEEKEWRTKKESYRNLLGKWKRKEKQRKDKLNKLRKKS